MNTKQFYANTFNSIVDLLNDIKEGKVTEDNLATFNSIVDLQCDILSKPTTVMTTAFNSIVDLPYTNAWAAANNTAPFQFYSRSSISNSPLCCLSRKHRFQFYSRSSSDICIACIASHKNTFNSIVDLLIAIGQSDLYSSMSFNSIVDLRILRTASIQL